MANETFWSLGMTTINQCYSYRSLDAVAATQIESTIWNLMGVAFIAMGEAVGIMMGHILGSGELEDAKKAILELSVAKASLEDIFIELTSAEQSEKTAESLEHNDEISPNSEKEEHE